jgi:hypothetical protein
MQWDHPGWPFLHGLENSKVPQAGQALCSLEDQASFSIKDPQHIQ